MKKSLHTFFYVCLLLLTNTAFSQNKNLSSSIVFDGEPFLIINPTNAQHLIVAWIGYNPAANGIKTSVSLNGGGTWSNPVFLPHTSPNFRSADPSMAFDNMGNLYCAYIDSKQSQDSGAVYMVKSTNGGISWGGMTNVIDVSADGIKKPVDRPWLSINPINNAMAITSKPPQGVSMPNRAYLAVSRDTNKTWTWRYVDTVGALIGNQIAAPLATNTFSNNGNLHIIYPSYVPTQNFLPRYIHAVSSNDGASFTYKTALARTVGKNDSLAKVGYTMISNPANPNHLVFNFIANIEGDQDVYIIETKDNGDTWSAPIRVNDDAISNGVMQDLPWPSFDTDGDLVVSWRDRRKTGSSGFDKPTEIYAAIRWKDSLNFSKNIAISDTSAPYNSTYLDESGNDFMKIDLLNDTLYAVWGDVRTGKQNIWFAKKSARNNLPLSINNINQYEMEIAVFPNPSIDFFYIKGLNASRIEIINANGQLCLSKKITIHDEKIDISLLPKGHYSLLLYSGQKTVTKNIIKQ